MLAMNPYPGRGIVIGLTPDGTNAALAYFVMGRSEQSRNRQLVRKEDGIYTTAIDDRKVIDPSLIIYAALKTVGNRTIVTNGDQTDTICDFLSQGKTFEDALKTREYEPDEPNYTPRISSMVRVARNTLTYEMSIIRERKQTPFRAFFEYKGIAGVGHMIHTYVGDGFPLPSFEGEPFEVGVMDDITDWTNMIWNSLNHDNRVALLTRFIALRDGTEVTRITNAYPRG